MIQVQGLCSYYVLEYGERAADAAACENYRHLQYVTTCVDAYVEEYKRNGLVFTYYGYSVPSTSIYRDGIGESKPKISVVVEMKKSERETTMLSPRRLHKRLCVVWLV